MAPKQKYYAVVRGHVPGIYTSWGEASKQVHGFPGALHQSFFSHNDAREYFNRCLNFHNEPPKIENLPTYDRTTIYTDGSSAAGEAGYGVVILYPDGEVKELSGKVPDPDNQKMRTNQQAELYAIAMAVHYTKGPVNIYTDSMYCINCIRDWAPGWIEKGWTTSKGDPVANQELITFIYNNVKDRSVTFKHVRGHTGDPNNERADRLAKQGRLSA